LRLNRYIAVSMTIHFILLVLFAIVYPSRPDRIPPFDVKIVGPFNIRPVTPTSPDRPAKPSTPVPVVPAPEKLPSIKNDIAPKRLHGEGTDTKTPEISNGTALRQEEAPSSDDSKSRDILKAKPSPEPTKRFPLEEAPSSDDSKSRDILKAKPSPEPTKRFPLFDKEIVEKFAKKESPTDRGLSFDTSEFQHMGYMRRLKERIESVWQYPLEAARKGIYGDLYIRFTILKNGRLGSAELVRTSGHKDLDEAAIKALKDAEPFWPLPEDYDKDSLTITGHFIYTIGLFYIR